MNAVVIEKPHQASLRAVPVPHLSEGQVLVRVAAVGICMSDVEVMEGTRPEPFVRYPVQPGHEWCGTVVEVGPGVRGLSAGQAVAVEGHNFCRTCFFCLRGETNLFLDEGDPRGLGRAAGRCSPRRMAGRSRTTRPLLRP